MAANVIKVVSQQACEAAARINTDPLYLERFNIRARLESEAVTNKVSPRTMHGYYCDHYVRNHLQEAVNDLPNLEDCIDYPDEIVYPPGVEDEDF